MHAQEVGEHHHAQEVGEHHHAQEVGEHHHACFISLYFSAHLVEGGGGGGGGEEATRLHRGESYVSCIL